MKVGDMIMWTSSAPWSEIRAGRMRGTIVAEDPDGNRPGVMAVHDVSKFTVLWGDGTTSRPSLVFLSNFRVVVG